MKLYTEEQVREAIVDAYWCCSKLEAECVFDKLIPIELPSDSLCINCDDSKSTHNICMDCIIKIGKENIELPSDEEIDNYARQSGLVHPFVERGAKWMRDKIQELKKL